MKKNLNEIKTINTKNLLRYFRAERKRMFGKGYKHIVVDEDELGNPILGWSNSSNSETFDDDINYLNVIKTELNNRSDI